MWDLGDKDNIGQSKSISRLEVFGYYFGVWPKEHSLGMGMELSSCLPPAGFQCCHPFKQEPLKRKPISKLHLEHRGCNSPALHISHSLCARAQGGSQMDQPTLLYPLIWLISRLVIMLQRNEGQWVGGEGTDLLAMEWQPWHLLTKGGGQEEEMEGGQQSAVRGEHRMHLFGKLLTKNCLYNQAIHPLSLMKQLPTAGPNGAPFNKECMPAYGCFLETLAACFFN